MQCFWYVNLENINVKCLFQDCGYDIDILVYRFTSGKDYQISLSISKYCVIGTLPITERDIPTGIYNTYSHQSFNLL